MAGEPTDQKLILVNGLILADPDNPKVASHGKTVIAGNRLEEVNEPVDGVPRAAEIMDCTGCLIMPGLVNAHNHSAMSLLRGLADDLPLESWLNDYMFPAEAKHVGEDFVRLGTRLSAVEMALGGTTTFADGYFFMEQAAKAALEVGIRSVIAQGVLDVPSPDAPVPGSWRERIEAFLSDFPQDSLVSPALFCHSAYLCGPETIKGLANICRQRGLPLFVHVAETAWEVQEMQKRYGAGPVEHLNNIGVLGEGLCAVHAVHVRGRELDLLARSGSPVVHCPESNMKLASGAAPISELTAAGVTVALGTDGPASNNNLDLFEEMRSASFMAKLVTGNPEALDARTVLRMATMGGARVLGMADRIGSLLPGKLADIVVVDFNAPHMTPLYDPLSHLVYSAKGSDVRHVLINGKLVVRNRQITTVQDRDIKVAARSLSAKIAADLGIKSFAKGLGFEIG